MYLYGGKSEGCQYNRNGVCTVFIAVESLTGWRFIHVSLRRTKIDYAAFKEMVAQHYAAAEEIVIVQDNLNTHNPISFYAAFTAEKAFALARRFEMHYTPNKASWLNMAEIELSILSKQCLDRRTGDQGTLAQEALAWAARRNARKATIHWQFTKNHARDKFKRFYPNKS